MRFLPLIFALALPVLAEKVVKMIRESELPAPVRKALAKHKPAGATFRGFEHELIDGKPFYEVQMIVNGKGKEILYHPDGKIEEMEDEITLEDIPAPAREAILKAKGTGTIRKVDKITAGKTISYEGELLINGQKSQVRFDANGKPAKH